VKKVENKVVYCSEYIKITKKNDGFYIESYKKGMTLEQFNKLISTHPEIKVNSFMTIKNALLNAPVSPAKFGELKDRIDVEVSGDELRAFITLSVTEDELIGEKADALCKEILKALNDKGVVFGIKKETLPGSLCIGKQILIAEGIAPVNGEDSIVRMYELKDPKPEIKEDGNADYYELNLINRVSEGEWLGERTDPTSGTPGKSVKGRVIPAVPGKRYPLMYDRESVREVYENGVTTLYSLRNGAVNYRGDRINVSNYLEINQDIDFKTGNIDFDGYLTVKGSVEDGFSVLANKDIEILGVLGIGSVKEILSRNGSIYIKGGIAGKSRAVIISKKDIFTKYVADATIICEGSVHIGFYCLNSNITAKEVILDSTKGQIIGGNINAEIRVVSSIIGSPAEKRTNITVKGFDRLALKRKLDNILKEIENLKYALSKVKQEMSVYSNTMELDKFKLAKFESVKDRFFRIKDDLKELEDQKKSLSSYLKAHGEGEVSVLKKVFPGTVIEIKNVVKEIERVYIGTNFYYSDYKINEL
jgi:uncharacterized protein (DUF342 family)